MNKIITIGREFGSGGRELGKRLAEILDIAYYDKEIITAISEKTSLAEDYVQQVVEKKPISFYAITVGHSFYPVTDPFFSQNSKIYTEQQRIITEMAQKSDCVIVGRCADYILRDMNPLRLFIYADMKSKMARCRQNAHEDEVLTDKELQKKIKSIDKQREQYYEFFTGNSWGDKLNFDVSINTTGKSIARLADAVAKLI